MAKFYKIFHLPRPSLPPTAHNNGIWGHRALAVSNTVLEALPEAAWGSDPATPSKKHTKQSYHQYCPRPDPSYRKKSLNIPANKRLCSETDP